MIYTKIDTNEHNRKKIKHLVLYTNVLVWGGRETVYSSEGAGEGL